MIVMITKNTYNIVYKPRRDDYRRIIALRTSARTERRKSTKSLTCGAERMRANRSLYERVNETEKKHYERNYDFLSCSH